MLLRVLLLGLFMCVNAWAVPTVDEIKAASGKQQLQLLNEYMKAQASVDARGALALLESLKPTLNLDQYPKQKLTLLLWQGVAENLIGNKRAALILLDTAITTARQNGFTEVAAEALKHRAMVYEEQTNFDLALQDAYELLSFAETIGNPFEIAVAQNILGTIYFSMTQFSKAFEWLLKANENYKHIGDIHGEVKIWGVIGSIYRSIGDFDSALGYQYKTIEGYRQLGSERGLSVAYNNTGIIYKDLGRYDEAINMHQQSLALKRKIGYERGMVYSFNNLGETHRLKGDLPAAKHFLAQAEALANKLNNRMLLGSTNLYLGRIAISERRYDDARRILNEAMSTYRKRNSASRIAEGLVEHANLSIKTNQPNLAISQLLEAIEYAQKSQKKVVLFKAYHLLAKVYADKGDYESAYKMQVTFQQSKDALFDLNSQQRIEMLVVKNKIDETRRSLEFVKQTAQLTEAELTNEINTRNLLILAVVSAVIMMGLAYSRYTQKRELKLTQASRLAIAEKEEKLSLALWASGDVLWSWDIQTQQVSRENVDDLSILPASEFDPDWLSLKEFVYKDDLEALVSHLQAIKDNQEDAFEVSYRVKNKAGEWSWVQDKGKVVKTDEQGNALVVAGIQHDITILKQQEADLVTLNTELELRVQQRTVELVTALEDLKATQQNLVEAEKMAALGSLVSGLAHEINTPLGTVIMAVTHLHAEIQQLEAKTQSGALSKQDLTASLSILADSAELIFKGMQRTSALVEQFKRVSVTQKGMGRTAIKFNELVNSAFSTVQDALGGPKNVTLLDAPTHTVVTYLDPLLQVIELLLSNAIQHSDPNQALTISTQVNDYPDHYEITVEDNGLGIAEHERGKIFDPFYTLARHKGHAGLGLNITFNLVSQVLEGTIYCEQSNMGGAKFVFTVKKEVAQALV